MESLYPSQISAVLPRRYVSSLIQCKVPFEVTRRHSPNHEAWDHWGSAYYKLDIKTHQNEALVNTEKNLAGSALVRYAAPCFSTFVESDAFYARGAIAQRSHFQSPSRLANHGMYTYTSPLRPGRAFSDPEDIDPILFLGEMNHHLWGRDPDRLVTEPIPFVTHLHNLFLGLRLVFEGQEDSLITPQDVMTSELALGQLADLPLDPLQALTQREVEGVGSILNEGLYPTLRTYATLIFCIQRIVRDDLNCQWRVFYS